MSATGGPAAAARLVYGPDERAAAAERWGLGDCEAGGAGPAEWAVLTDRLAASTDSLDSAVHRVAMDYLAERQAAAYWEGTPLLPTGPEAEAAAQAAVGARPDCPAARAITATAAENGAGIAEVARSVRHGLARPDEACNEIYDWVDEINAVAARLGCGSVADAEKSCDGAWRLAGELDAGWGTDRLMSLLDLMLEWDRWDEPAAAPAGQPIRVSAPPSSASTASAAVGGPLS